MKAVPLEQRFWPKVAIAAPDECWIWQGAKCGHGYGAIRRYRERGNIQAHRASYEMANGPIPAGMHVLHRCDTPACVNPAHLFLGTHKDNMADKVAKGRNHGAVGARNCKAKLRDDLVREIRAARGRQKEIGARFGVSQTTVWKIKHGLAWGHVA